MNILNVDFTDFINCLNSNDVSRVGLAVEQTPVGDDQAVAGDGEATACIVEQLVRMRLGFARIGT